MTSIVELREQYDTKYWPKQIYVPSYFDYVDLPYFPPLQLRSIDDIEAFPGYSVCHVVREAGAKVQWHECPYHCVQIVWGDK